MEEMNLIISYDSKQGYIAAKNEIQDILTQLGDQKADKELLVPGTIGVKTEIKNRKVVEEVRDIFMSNPSKVSAAIKWVPIDHWCKPNLEDSVAVVKEEIAPLITAKDRFKLRLENHNGSLEVEKLNEDILKLIKGKEDKEYPDKIIRIHLFEDRIGMALVGKHDVFSLIKKE